MLSRKRKYEKEDIIFKAKTEEEFVFICRKMENQYIFYTSNIITAQDLILNDIINEIPSISANNFLQVET